MSQLDLLKALAEERGRLISLPYSQESSRRLEAIDEIEESIWAALEVEAASAFEKDRLS